MDRLEFERLLSWYPPSVRNTMREQWTAALDRYIAERERLTEYRGELKGRIEQTRSLKARYWSHEDMKQYCDILIDNLEERLAALKASGETHES